MLADLLRLFIRIGADTAHHVGEIVRRGLIAIVDGVLAVGVVETHRGVHGHQEGGVGVAEPGGPLDGLRLPVPGTQIGGCGFCTGSTQGLMTRKW